MAGLGRVVVGYRKGDRRIYKLEHEYGMPMIAVRTCAAGCGYPVYFNRSGLNAAHERDPEVICEQCCELHRPELLESAL